MEELKRLKEKLEQERPAVWDELPDIALYMDQLISYMPRQLIRFDEEEQLTSAMVNNYIKDGLVPRAEGKRYGKSHLAALTSVCALKKALSVKDAAVLLDALRGDRSAREMYEDFADTLDGALRRTAETLNVDVAEEALPHLALELALRSYADQLVCARVMAVLRARQPEQDKSKEKNKKLPKEGGKDHE